MQLHKKDLSNDYWFYEFRPYLILAFGIVGVLNKQNPHVLIPFLSQACGITLLFLGVSIIKWRREYRRAWKR